MYRVSNVNGRNSQFPEQNGSPAQQQSVKPALFSQRNMDALENALAQDFQGRLGALSPQQKDRLGRTVEHYVNEVYEIQGEKQLATLNREIIRAASSDFGKYLQRKDAVRDAPESAVKTVMNESLFQETGKRFELLQQERHEVKALPPSTPDFRISLDDDSPSSADLFEKAKKARESEALRLISTQIDAMDRIDSGVVRRNTADDMFRQQQQNMSRATDLVLQERRTQPKPMETPLIVPPDRRELILPASFSVAANPGPLALDYQPRNVIVPGSSMIPPFQYPLLLEPAPTLREMGQANGNPTITEPQITSIQKRNLQQDILIKQDDYLSWREVENNLFVYSGDRDWLKNIKENRYSFTVNFDPANNGQQLPPSPAAQQRFKDITRIELVKAILPAESVDILIARDDDAFVTSYQSSVLSMPYITTQIQELDGNNYGTDNFLDRSFGVLQYDANWYSDPTSLVNPQDSRGYLAMIPKFMKCQRVYHPTPLATLQKMSISMLRPDGSLISNSADTLDITSAFASDSGTFIPSIYDVTIGGQPAYFFIQTRSYFSRFQVAIGDRIQVAGYSYDDATLAANPGLLDFSNYLNRCEGHQVAAIGHSTTIPVGGSSPYTADGANNVGYANYIIIQARYADPTTGSTALVPFTNITNALAANTGSMLLPRRLINLNRQIQLVFRVLTRVLDPVGNLRPDNA